MKIALAQSQFRLGDFENNYKQLLVAFNKSKGKADLLVFPEGGLWSYPPKDFLFHKKFFQIQNQKIKQLSKLQPSSLAILLPGFCREKNQLKNGVFLIQKNKQRRFFAKEFLPDQNVFFESRYFEKGSSAKKFFLLEEKKNPNFNLRRFLAFF